MPRYSELEARAAVGSSRCYSEALRKLGLRPAGGNHRLFRTYVDEIWRIPTDHFDPEARLRECARCGAGFVARYESHRYCSPECGRRHGNRRRGPKPDARKVVRPSYEQLVADVESIGYSAVGRAYGVSDNAVRKWLRSYRRERGEG